MAHDIHHEHLIREVAELFEPVFSTSPQAMYIYLDDTHKICNQKFADMLGYTSTEEWGESEFPISDIAEVDQERSIQAYIAASEHLKASTVEAEIIKKDGKRVLTDIMMIPFPYREEIFVIHFISEKKN